jgi:ketosteroid isomerase-like protein
MSTKSLIWESLAFLMLVTGAASQAAPPGGDEQAVIAAEQQWLKAQQTNNVDLLAPLLADKVVETTGGGKVIFGKDAVLADAKANTWTSVDYTDLKVTLFGTTAIATGAFVGKGKDAAGKSLDEHERFTDTWVKTASGKWQCVASHDSSVTT